MPATEHGKAIASRNATTHGLFARDIVLPALGEDPQAYRRLEAEWMAQLPPRTLLERHYVEKIAAASWRLRRLHRWQAQLFEDETLTEGERLDRLDKVLRHETALHRQIDTAVKMLGKDAPQLYAAHARSQVLEDAWVSERECRDDAEQERMIDLETRSRLYRIRKATQQAGEALAHAPLDTAPGEPAGGICGNELPPASAPACDSRKGERQADADEICGNEDEICGNEPDRLGARPSLAVWSRRHWNGLPARDPSPAQEASPAAGGAWPPAEPSRPPGTRPAPSRAAACAV